MSEGEGNSASSDLSKTDPIYTVVYPRRRSFLGTLVLGLLVGGLLVGAGVFAVGGNLSSPTPSGAATAPSPTPFNVTLTVAMNPLNGWPQYTPANFSIPRGEVTITIVDDDVPMSFPGCNCNVTGTLGNVEYVNGTATHLVSNANVAHTFDVPSLGINVLSPAMSTVTFTAFFNQTGTFSWICEAPCGAASPTAPPMGVPGYMAGTISVV